MTGFQANLIEQLNALLDKEKQALLTADFASLSSLLEEKGRLASMLGETPGSDAPLERLKSKILANQALFDECMAAIRTTARRISELRRHRNSVSTYTRMGKIRLLQPNTAMSVEKKA